MPRLASNQYGFSHLVIGLGFVVIAVVAAAGYRIAATTDTAQAPSSAVAHSSVAPKSITSSADVKKADESLDATNIDSGIDASQLDSDISALN